MFDINYIIINKNAYTIFKPLEDIMEEENANKPTQKISKKYILQQTLKIFGICLGAFAVLVGAISAYLGISGKFYENVPLSQIAFSKNVYVIDGNLEKYYHTESSTPSTSYSQVDDTYHLDYRTKQDQSNNPIYETIEVVANEGCTELDAQVTVITQGKIQIVEDSNTIAIKENETQNQQQAKDGPEYRKYNVKIGTPIKIKPITQTVAMKLDGADVSRSVNVGGWAQLRVKHGMYIATCWVFVDTPVYAYDIDPVDSSVATESQVGGGDDSKTILLVNSTNDAGGRNSFAIGVDTAKTVPTNAFSTVYSNIPTDAQNIDFNLSAEVQKLYSNKNKQIVYRSTDESVATVSQNSDNTATVTIMPNSYGKEFSIESYVVGTYNNYSNLPSLEDFNATYTDGTAEQKYNDALDRLRIKSNVVNFKVNEVELETFAVAQNLVDYYVFDDTNLSLVRDGTQNENSAGTYHFDIALNQHFSNETDILDEILNSIQVKAVYANPNSTSADDHYVAYEGDDAPVVISQNDNGGWSIKVNKTASSNKNYLQFSYTIAGIEDQTDTNQIDAMASTQNDKNVLYAYAPFQVLVHDSTISINSNISLSNLKYYGQMYDDEPSINNDNDLSEIVDPIVTATDGKNVTYDKVMYFVHFADETHKFVSVDESISIKIGGVDYYAVGKQKKDGYDYTILQLTDAGLNADMVVAIMRVTKSVDNEGNQIEKLIQADGGGYEYYALAQNSNGNASITVSATQQLEIVTCNVESQIVDDSTAGEGKFKTTARYDLLNQTAKSFSLPKNSRVVLTIEYYGNLDDSDIFALTQSAEYVASSIENNKDGKTGATDQKTCVVTFTTTLPGAATIEVLPNTTLPNKAVTIFVQKDAITALTLESDDATNDVIDVSFDLAEKKYSTISQFKVTIVPNDSTTSTTCVRTFTLDSNGENSSIRSGLISQLGLQTDATDEDILSALNDSLKARIDLFGYASSEDIIKTGTYSSLGTTFDASVVSAGNVLVLVYAVDSDGTATLASNAILVKVEPLQLVAENWNIPTINVVGDISKALLKTKTFNADASTTETNTAYDLSQIKFKFNGKDIDANQLKFAFASSSGTNTSSLGTELTGTGTTLKFANIAKQQTETIIAYIADGQGDRLCTCNLSFTLVPDYKLQTSSVNFENNPTNLYNLFELDSDLKPKVVVTNIDFDANKTTGNKLYVPEDFELGDDVTISDSSFFKKFYYSDGTSTYYHIYKILNVRANGATSTNGTITLAESASVIIQTSSSYKSSRIGTDGVYVQIVGSTQSTAKAEFANVEYKSGNVELYNTANTAQYVKFSIPTGKTVSVESMDFDTNSAPSDYATISQTADATNTKTMVATIGPKSYNLFAITKNADGSFVLSSASDFDTAKSLLHASGVTELSFDINVSFSLDDGTMQTDNLTVTVNLA